LGIIVTGNKGGYYCKKIKFSMAKLSITASKSYDELKLIGKWRLYVRGL